MTLSSLSSGSSWSSASIRGRRRRSLIWVVPGVFLCLFLGCGAEIPVISRPLADAGSDQRVNWKRADAPNPSLTIMGSADGETTIVRWAWRVSSSPEGSGAWISGADGRRAAFHWDRAGQYVLSLSVTDEHETVSEPDYLLVHVIETGSHENTPPKVSLFLGPNPNPVVGDTIEVKASVNDADGDPLSCAWSFEGVAAEEISANCEGWSGQVLEIGTLKINVDVSDGAGHTTGAGAEIKVSGSR